MSCHGCHQVVAGGEGGGSTGGSHLHTFTIVLIVLGCVFTVVTLALCVVTAATNTLCFAKDDNYRDKGGETGISYTNWRGKKSETGGQDVIAVVDRAYVVGQDYHPPRQ